MKNRKMGEHFFAVGKKYKRVAPESAEEYKRVALKVVNSLKDIEFSIDGGLYFDTGIGDKYLALNRPNLAKYGPGQRPKEMLDFSLYGGTSGIVYYLLKAYELSGEEIFLEKARKSLVLICKDYKSIFTYEHVSIPEAKNGYYFGIGGVGGVLLEADAVLGDPLYKKTIEEMIDYMNETRISTEDGIYWGHQLGLIGDPGVIIFLLRAYRRYGNELALSLAKQAGDYIATYREETEYGFKYDTRPLYGNNCPNFVYGPSGTAYAITQLYIETGKESYLTIAKELAEYLMNIAVDQPEGKLIPYMLDTDDTIFYINACHGPGGTGRFFYSLYKATGEEKYHSFSLELYKGMISNGAPTTQSKTLWNNVTYCCGTAGILHYLISLYLTEKEEQYLELAKVCGEIILGEMEEDEEEVYWPTAFARIDPDTIDIKAGYYDGSTGIAVSLIELYLLLEGKYHFRRLPDDPFPEIMEQSREREQRGEE
ncbi:MAG: hypothetical protein IJ061_10660 [Lachnospiraceae bacterium]|nr:hypothetical protein [Lachnospiraceae bacterium]